MTQVIGKYAAKKIMGEGLKRYGKRGKENGPESQYDPYFDIIWDERKGRAKKVKKQVPAYIPEHDAVILAKMRKRSYRLDMGLFNLFGIRFGWSSVIAIIPAIGDVLDALMAYMLIRSCSQVECGLGSVEYRMYFNLMLDFAIGLVPFVGDLADAAYKCNSRNVRLLEERLDEVYKPKEVLKREKEQRRSWHPHGKYDVRGKPPAPATVYEDFSDEEEERSYEMRNNGQAPTRPQPARVPSERMGGPAPDRSNSRKLFGGKTRPTDEEMGPQETGVSGGRRSNRR